MNNLSPSSTDGREPSLIAGKLGAARCLVVHDDLELRLRLASLARRAVAKLDADCLSGAGFDALPPERMAGYAALLLIVEFNLRNSSADPLTRLVRSRSQAPHRPIFVFARGGDERNAARTMKLGATDYWPVHSVKIGELSAVLQPLIEPASASTSTTGRGGRSAASTANRGLPGGTKTIAESAAAATYTWPATTIWPSPWRSRSTPSKGRYEVTDADRQRFVRECRILSSLNHRSIADVLDFGVTDDYLYLALEYFPCGSLRDRLKNPGERGRCGELRAPDRARRSRCCTPRRSCTATSSRRI